MITEIFGRFKKQFYEDTGRRKKREATLTADSPVGEEETYRNLDKEELIRQLLLRDIEIAKLKSAATLGLEKTDKTKKSKV